MQLSCYQIGHLHLPAVSILKVLFDDDIEMKEVEYFTISNENHLYHDTNQQMVETSTIPSAIVLAQVAL
jgi:hypothetical protein